MTTYILQGARADGFADVAERLVVLLVAGWLIAAVLVTVSIGPAPAVAGTEPAACPATAPEPGRGLDL